MSLMDAPAYDPTRDNRNRNLGIAAAVIVALLVILTFAGFLTGHGWLFSNLGYEHQTNDFFVALEQKDYPKAFAIYNHDADWQQHPQKYADYPLPKFTEDWTTYSPVHGPILAHHVDISVQDGSGTFGTGIIIAVKINHAKEIFMYINRKDKTMTWPAPHVLTRY
jgi:hypothetical protein